MTARVHCRSSTLSKTPNHSDFALNKQALLEIKKLEGPRRRGGPLGIEIAIYIMVW